MRVLQLGNEDATGKFDFALKGEKVSVGFGKPTTSMSFKGLGIVIIPRALSVTSAAPASPDGKAEIAAFIARLENARMSGTHACVTLDFWETESSALLRDLLPAGLKTVEAEPSTLVSDTSEMEQLARIYGRRDIAIEYSEEDLPQFKPVLTATQAESLTRGVVDTSLNGFLYVLPAFPLAGDEARFIKALVAAIQAHAARFEREIGAAIMNDFTFKGEIPLRERQTKLTQQLEKAEDRISEYADRKSILYLRGDSLAEELPEWMDTNLQLKTRRFEEYIEDFWLLDLSTGDDIALVEVKSATQNAKRKHVAAVLLHREEREKGDDFPALLVVNSFADADSVKVKDKQRISPKVLDLAIRNGVLIIRTLDLLRMADLLEQGKVNAEEIQMLLTTNPGWLHVDRDLNVSVVRDE